MPSTEMHLQSGAASVPAALQAEPLLVTWRASPLLAASVLNV